MSGPMRVRKRPVEVEAMQLTKDTLGAVVRWLPLDQLHSAGDDEQGLFVRIRTLEGVMRANAGDWIVRGVKGEHHPVRGDVFVETYDVLDEAQR